TNVQLGQARGRKKATLQLKGNRKEPRRAAKSPFLAVLCGPSRLVAVHGGVQAHRAKPLVIENWLLVIRCSNQPLISPASPSYHAPMKIGLLGGAFDPPHLGHLAVARAVRAARGLDRVDLLVSGQSPHAEPKDNHASLEHRLAMARLAVEGEPGLGVED